MTQDQLAITEWTLVDGVPVTTVQRAPFDEVRRIDGVREKANAIAMAAAARLISTRLFERAPSPTAARGPASRAPATPYAWQWTTAARRRSSGC